MPFKILYLTEKDVPLLQSINSMFGEVFDDEENYASNPPSSNYLEKLLSTQSFIALAAVDGQRRRCLSL